MNSSEATRLIADAIRDVRPGDDLATAVGVIQAVLPLSKVRVSIIRHMVHSLTGELVKSYRNPSPTSIATPIFCEYFGCLLRIHHATIYDKFKKESFETAFCLAMSTDNRPSRVITPRDNAGEDILFNGVKCSMKTEASEGSRPNVITISKFMEVNGISRNQWGGNVDLCINDVVARFTKHLAHYERIFMLKGYDSTEDWIDVHKYDLWEIPKSLFQGAGVRTNQIRPTAFTSKGGFTIRVLSGGKKAFSLCLDGSDEKIRISSLKTDKCIKHASWSVRK